MCYYMKSTRLLRKLLDISSFKIRFRSSPLRTRLSKWAMRKRAASNPSETIYGKFQSQAVVGVNWGRRRFLISFRKFRWSAIKGLEFNSHISITPTTTSVITSSSTTSTMESYESLVKDFNKLLADKKTWNAIEPENAARMKVQNRFQSGVEIAQYCAKIMREDMAAYEKDPSKYTQSLGCWHGFVAQQVMISIKKHFQTTKRKYLYLSGWMVAAMRSEFGPLPDQVRF